MKLVLCLLNLGLLFVSNEAAVKKGKDILAECAAAKVGQYYKPMKPCLDKCAQDAFGTQNQLSKCFFDDDPNRYLPGTNCLKKDATCYKKKSKKRNPRDVQLWNEDFDDDVIDEGAFADDPEAEGHQRFERASSTTTDVYTQVINDAVSDAGLKAKLLAYRKCKFECPFKFHKKNRDKLLGGKNRHKRSIRNMLEGVDDSSHPRERRMADDAYFNAYFGHCYKRANCRSTGGVANKCMALFFPKKDPKKICQCFKQFNEGGVNCDRYNEASATANQQEPQRSALLRPQRKPVMNMNFANSGVSGSGSAGGNNFFAFGG